VLEICIYMYDHILILLLSVIFLDYMFHDRLFQISLFASAVDDNLSANGIYFLGVFLYFSLIL